LAKELRSEIRNWNLGSDKKLMQYLERFQDDLMMKTKTLQNDLDNLHFETRSAELKLDNCFNSLMSLSSHQFIENRVYDEEPDEEEKPVKKEEPKESKEEELVPKFTAALAAGLAALEYYSQPVSADQIPKPG